MEVPIDVADALQEALNARGHHASGDTMPADFEGLMPFTRVEALGGARTHRVRDAFTVDFEVRAATMGEAMAEAGLVMAEVASMEGGTVGGSQCYRVQVWGLPQPGDDPDRPHLAMASFTATVAVRTTHT